jgi:hypothetical protein
VTPEESTDGCLRLILRLILRKAGLPYKIDSSIWTGRWFAQSVGVPLEKSAANRALLTGLDKD